MKLWQWQEGRQVLTKYLKFPLWYFRIWKWGFDAYILKYEQDTYLSTHKDIVKNAQHWRLNIKLKGRASFYCQGKLPTYQKVTFFRPDLCSHNLYIHTKTIKLSFGFVKYN